MRSRVKVALSSVSIVLVLIIVYGKLMPAKEGFCCGLGGGGSSSKSETKTSMELTDISNEITENITTTKQDILSTMTLSQEMTVERGKFFGCELEILQRADIEQDTASIISADQVDEVESEIKKQLVMDMKNNLTSETGAARLPIGDGSKQSQVTDTDIDQYIETNKLMANVKDVMSSVIADIDAKQKLDVIKPFADPCGWSIYEGMFAAAKTAEVQKLVMPLYLESQKLCPDPRPTCKIEQSMFVKQVVSAGLTQLATNVQKHMTDIGMDVSTTSTLDTKDKGAFEEVGDGIGSAAKGTGEGVATAAKGAGEGVGTAAKGVGDAISSIFSPGVIIAIILGLGVAAFMYYKMSQGGGKNPRFTK